MNTDAFERLEEALSSGGSQAGFEFLAMRLRDEKNYPGLFEARLMKLRHELGLPLIQTEPASQLPDDQQRIYHERSVEAAREAGRLFLEDGQIDRAWPYFRAIGETEPVVEAIEKLHPEEASDRVVELAFFERVNPKKGFEFILEKFGICRAITLFSHYPGPEGREESAKLLVRTLHQELVENLKRTIAGQEGEAPETESIPELLRDREWLFEGNSYYVDTSHVASVVQLGPDLADRETLRLLVELTEYGRRLGPMYQFHGEPPFEDIYGDHAMYFRALLGERVEEAVAHFRKKVSESDPARVGDVPAQVLVKLLARLGRYEEALEISRQHLSDSDPGQLLCPSPLQLCQMAGDYDQLREVARSRGDLLSFAAAAIQEGRQSPVSAKD